MEFSENQLCIRGGGGEGNTVADAFSSDVATRQLITGIGGRSAVGSLALDLDAGREKVKDDSTWA